MIAGIFLAGMTTAHRPANAAAADAAAPPAAAEVSGEGPLPELPQPEYLQSDATPAEAVPGDAGSPDAAAAGQAGADDDAQLQEEPVFAPPSIEDRIAALEQQLAILKREAEIREEAAFAAAPTAAVTTASDRGFTIASGDKAYQIKLRGYMHGDTRFALDDDGERVSDTFTLRRVRPIVEGTLGRIFGFKVMPDFGGGATTLLDAYIDADLDPALKLRIGKFKPPVGLERLQSATDIKWIERGLPTNLVPNRDTGLQVSGDLFEGRASYALGFFNGAPDGGSRDDDAGDSKEWAARLMLQPFANEPGVLQGLSFGVAASVGDKEGAADLGSLRSQSQQRFFQYRSATGATTVADGGNSRLSPQFTWTWQGFGLLGEYVRSSTRVAQGSARRSLEHEAWQVAGTWLLTGEEASFKAVNPSVPFTLGADGWGAVELVARVASLDVDDEAFEAIGGRTFADPSASASRADSWGVGVNWYLSRNLKASLQYERTEFDGGGGTGDREDEKLLFSRVQVSW